MAQKGHIGPIGLIGSIGPISPIGLIWSYWSHGTVGLRLGATEPQRVERAGASERHDFG